MLAILKENPRKLLILLLLLVQNTGLALSVKASKDAEKSYIPSTVVILNEVIKFIVCAAIYLSGRDHDSSERSKPSFSHFFHNLTLYENLPFVVPCIIFATQNNLVFVALGLIDAALYQVLTYGICA